MQDVFKIIGQVAASEVTVMITGESGTGKELIARAIWQHSHRSARPYQAVNCAAIPENLIESELFGHEKGSFTGATQQRAGRFEMCDGGTLFLDEIGDMALPTQTKILRALQEGEIQRVGGNESIKVDVRVIAATNKDLETMIAEKSFREDLYYRLNVMRIRLPALRERSEDIPALVDFMIQRMQKNRQTRVRQVSAEALATLQHYPWPGNVRELENVVQRAAVIAKGDTILTKDLPIEVTSRRRAGGEISAEDGEMSGAGGTPTEAPVGDPVTGDGAGPALDLDGAFDLLLEKLRQNTNENILQVIERAMIERVLAETGGNQVKASTILGITRATLRKRIDQFGLKL